MNRPVAGFLVFLVMLCGLAAPAAGQVTTDSAVWMGFVAQGKFADASPWTWSADSLLRTRDFAGVLDAVGQRIIIGRDLGRGSSVAGGYLVGKVYPSGRDALTEQRAVQQYVWAGAVGRGTSVSVRTRLEERLITGNNHPAVRVREQFKIAIPLAADRLTSLVLADEILVHVNQSRVLDRGFDSQRFYAGLRRSVNARLSVEVGYYNVYAHGRNGLNRRHHVLSALVGHSF